MKKTYSAPVTEIIVVEHSEEVTCLNIGGTLSTHSQSTDQPAF